MIINENLRKEVLPNKIFALLKFVEYKDRTYTKEQLKNFIQPAKYEERFGVDDIFLKNFNWAKDNNMIDEDIDTKKVYLKINKEYIKDLKVFRAFLANEIFKSYDKDNLFYKFTSYYLAQDQNILWYKSFEKFINSLSGEFSTLDKEFILAWRLWCNFLGLGILSEQFIPYPYDRIKDCLLFNKDKFIWKQKLKIGSFMEELLKYCPELTTSSEKNTFSFGMSLALRRLHDDNFIILEKMQDAMDVWRLQPSNSHNINEQITHITLVGE